MNKESVSIIIPFRDKIDLLNECLRTLSISLDTEKENVELLLLNNGSSKESLEKLQIPKDVITKTLDVDIPFNYQKLMNIGVKESTGKFILFLNNDIVFTKESLGFLQKMRQHAAKEHIGCVGPLLLFPDYKIQHAGVVIDIMHSSYHLYRSWTTEESLRFPFKRYDEDRYVSSLTGACLMLEKTKFEQINGMDERYKAHGGDIDLCLRIHEAGYKNLYLGSVSMIHLENQTVNRLDLSESDLTLLKTTYHSFLSKHQGKDPYYPYPLCVYPQQPCTWRNRIKNSLLPLLNKTIRKVFIVK